MTVVATPVAQVLGNNNVNDGVEQHHSDNTSGLQQNYIMKQFTL